MHTTELRRARRRLTRRITLKRRKLYCHFNRLWNDRRQQYEDEDICCSNPNSRRSSFARLSSPRP